MLLSQLSTSYFTALQSYQQADAEELERLFQGLEVLGRSEHAEQYARTIERLGRREGELRAAGREKRRLYASLGAMTGLAVSILLI